MTGNALRRALLALTFVAAALLSSCGGSTIASALVPSRMIAFGDGMSDVGEVTGKRWTVNDGSVNVWAEQVATSYGMSLTAADQGGWGYARGGTKVADIAVQIDAFLAKSSFGQNDVVMVSAGMADIRDQMDLYMAGQLPYQQLLENVDLAGRNYGAVVQRLVNAGAKHILVTGVYGLGTSPYARALNQVALMNKLSYDGDTCTGCSRAFNQAFLIAINKLGADVLYVDSANYFNSVYTNPGNYLGSGANADDIACTTLLVTECTPDTIVAGANYNVYMFASDLYLTPTSHRLFGVQAYNNIRGRW